MKRAVLSAVFSLLSLPVFAVECTVPVEVPGGPVPRFWRSCVVTHAETLALLNAPVDIIPGKPDTMILPVFGGISKPEGTNYVTGTARQLGFEWSTNPAHGGSAMMFGNLGFYLFVDEDASSIVALNINNGGAPYFWASYYTVDGQGIKLTTRGGNLGPSLGTGGLVVVMEWLEVPAHFGLPEQK